MATIAVDELGSRAAELLHRDEPVMVTRDGDYVAVLYPIAIRTTSRWKFGASVSWSSQTGSGHSFLRKSRMKTSSEILPNLESSVAADSNVLLSAFAKRAARRVFDAPGLAVVTTDVTLAEVYEVPLPIYTTAQLLRALGM
jgi:antitoxin (DNA-binding transcriptional repressor) of toxin-antitoxin stability system